MQHEVRLIHASQRVDHLLVVASTECRYNKTLGLAACEQCGTVCPWQDTCLGNDWADGVESTAVDTLAVFHNVAAQNRRFKLLKRWAQVCVGLLLFSQRRNNVSLGSRNRTSALLLVCDRISSTHFLFTSCFNSSGKIRVINWLEVERLFCAIFG